MTPDQLAQTLAHEQAVSRCDRLTGGNIHYIYALGDHLILKIRADHVATLPTVPLKVTDISKEVSVLESVSHLSGAQTGLVVPRVFTADNLHGWMIMERVAAPNSFLDKTPLAVADATALGNLMACLHSTLNTPTLAQAFVRNTTEDNFFELYVYHRLGDTPQSQELAGALHAQTLQPVHGDLMLKNIARHSQGHAVIDWEYAHIGSPVFEYGFILVDMARQAGTAHHAAPLLRSFLRSVEQVTPEAVSQEKLALMSRVARLTLEHRASVQEQKNLSALFAPQELGAILNRNKLSVPRP